MDADAAITQHIARLPDWQATFLTVFREQIHAAAPDISEDWKWSTPVYAHEGRLICATGVFKDHVKINFFKGALLADQSHFNAGLESKNSRAVDYAPGDTVDAKVIRQLVKGAIALSA